MKQNNKNSVRVKMKKTRPTESRIKTEEEENNSPRVNDKTIHLCSTSGGNAVNRNKTMNQRKEGRKGNFRHSLCRILSEYTMSLTCFADMSPTKVM